MWVPIQLSSLSLDIFDNGGYFGGANLVQDSIVASVDGGQCWGLGNSAGVPVLIRITANSYQNVGDIEETRCLFEWYDSTGTEHNLLNELPAVDPGFQPEVFEAELGIGQPLYYWQAGQLDGGSGNWQPESFAWFIEVWEGGGPDPEPVQSPFKFTQPSNAYELDMGWSFDGQYIPHFLELNWFFGEDPVTYKMINKVRVHGLVKGVVNLQVSMSGMQGDVATDYIPDYTVPEFLDFPFSPILS